MPRFHRFMRPASVTTSAALLLMSLSPLPAFGRQVRGDSLRSDPESDRPLARWDGGSLSVAAFVERYDPSTRALTSGGPVLRETVCKAVYREIYVRRAHDLGIHRSREFVEELAAAREERLGRLYVEVHGPRLSSVDEQRVRDYFDAHSATDYTSTGHADVEILFVRLSEGAGQDEGRRRFERIRRQIGSGEVSWEEAISEERKISGPANGTFQGVGLGRLASEIREAVLRAEVGGPGQVVETDLGLFLIRVDARVPGSVLAFEDVADSIRQQLWRADVTAWKAEAAEALRREFDSSGPVSDDSLLAAAARNEGLDRADALVSSMRDWESWRLADLALFADERIVPNPDRILDRIREDPKMRSEYLRFSVSLVVFDAASNRAGAIRGAEKLMRRLAAGEVGQVLLAEDPVRQTIRLTDLHRSDLDRIHRGLEASLAGAEPGSSYGPFPVPRPTQVFLEDPRGSFSRCLDLPSGVIIAVLDSTRLPEPQELVREVQRDIRASIGSCGSLERWLGPLWHLEILTP